MDLDRLCVVLGFLDEADGRHVRDDEPDVVESFYGDERDKAVLFKRHLEALARERGIATQIRQSDDGRVVLRSAELAALINGSYEDVRSSPYLDPVTGRSAGKQLHASLALFRDTRSALSFLAGAYARYGHERSFRIPIAQRKVDLIARLLAQLSCSDLAVTYLPTHVPRVYVLSYQPTPVVAAWLARARDL